MSYRRYRTTKQSYSEDVHLITYESEENEIGEWVKGDAIKRLVMARAVGLSRNEIYQSKVAGLNPSLALEIKSIEYQGEEELEYNGQRYQIIKTFPLGTDIELTCEKVLYGKND